MDADRLTLAPIEVVGRFADASNATFLVRLLDRDPRTTQQLAEEAGGELTIDDLDAQDLAVYKPQRGERPLWDFPHGTLHRREVAAYEVSEALGWELVPLTVLRDGPLGAGSLQRFVEHDPDHHWFSLVESADERLRAQLERVVVFDLVIDNADRKAGHVLLEDPVDVGGRTSGTVRLVDHGVSFHVERKLRTVAWDYHGIPLDESVRDELARLKGHLDATLGERLGDLLAEPEIDRLRARIGEVLELDVLPEPTGRRPYPWPML